MDDIEFRAWYKKREYIPVISIHMNGEITLQNGIRGYWKGQFKDSELEQYTGRKDIFTDQKCYVNDLIDWYDRHKDKIVRFKVVFKDGSFVGVPIDSPNISYSLSILLNMTTHSEAGKIVGNIHE